MTMWAKVLVILGCAVLIGAAAPPSDRYAEGQVWEYTTRSQDAGSLFKIQKIEDGGKLGKIYHISIIDIVLSDKTTTELAHAPVSRATLDASVTRLSGTKHDWPDVEPGIAEWRENKGGVFTIPVAEIVGAIEQAIMRQRAATAT
jgi:hypothetical protein